MRKRKRGGDENSSFDKSDETSKDGTEKAGSDDEVDDEAREPKKFDLAVDTAQIERGKFTSVRDYFGEDEAVYIMDAKTTGNIGRYLNVRIVFFYSHFVSNLLFVL